MRMLCSAVRAHAPGHAACPPAAAAHAHAASPLPAHPSVFPVLSCSAPTRTTLIRWTSPRSGPRTCSRCSPWDAWCSTGAAAWRGGGSGCGGVGPGARDQGLGFCCGGGVTPSAKPHPPRPPACPPPPALCSNPDNFFNENEQLAFCPALVVPGARRALALALGVMGAAGSAALVLQPHPCPPPRPPPAPPASPNPNRRHPLQRRQAAADPHIFVPGGCWAGVVEGSGAVEGIHQRVGERLERTQMPS